MLVVWGLFVMFSNFVHWFYVYNKTCMIKTPTKFGLDIKSPLFSYGYWESMFGDSLNWTHKPFQVCPLLNVEWLIEDVIQFLVDMRPYGVCFFNVHLSTHQSNIMGDVLIISKDVIQSILNMFSWSSPNYTPIKYKRPIKKSNGINTQIYLVWSGGPTISLVWLDN